MATWSRWREGPAAWISAVSGVALVILGIVTWRASTDDDQGRQRSPTTRCAQEGQGPTPANRIDSSTTLTPPANVTVDVMTDERRGRYRLVLRWRTTDERATGNIAIVTGRYGVSAPEGDDFPTAGNQQLASEGECGTWLRRLGRGGPANFDGMWPSEVYCFRVWSTDDDGARQPPVPSPQSLPTCVETGPA